MSIQELKDIMTKWELMSKKRKGIDSFNTFHIFFIIIIIFLILLIPFKILVAKDYDSGEYLKSWRIKNGFTVSYTHSVELTEVLEIYSIEGKNIVLNETYFHSYGA